jgi:hypothetical protein
MVRLLALFGIMALSSNIGNAQSPRFGVEGGVVTGVIRAKQPYRDDILVGARLAIHLTLSRRSSLELMAQANGAALTGDYFGEPITSRPLEFPWAASAN